MVLSDWRNCIATMPEPLYRLLLCDRELRQTWTAAAGAHWRLRHASKIFMTVRKRMRRVQGHVDGSRLTRTP
jgi:hypothetical protein